MTLAELRDAATGSKTITISGDLALALISVAFTAKGLDRSMSEFPRDPEHYSDHVSFLEDALCALERELVNG